MVQSIHGAGYHVATDNSFPYWIYTTQQDAGAIATRSRAIWAITSIDWKPVPGWEWGTDPSDPRDPNVIYSSGLGISKITYPSGEWINVGPEQDPSLKLPRRRFAHRLCDLARQARAARGLSNVMATATAVRHGPS